MSSSANQRQRSGVAICRTIVRFGPESTQNDSTLVCKLELTDANHRRGP
jgi:hypothetical protein